ncbi:response regulator transcription factor [Paenibacillus thalictri]|uniref:Response regulator n=1 Tax=Paenibacillus thalictri TaxID=2527873 RepID=A0A4Q9DXC7_9BACL|nr:response regulator [Paenibacillus thalictri]TBL81066.1 response regulator [Paenibacillus thalictri]
MNKVMIIDDNALIRKAIRSTMDWKGMDCEVVGEAGDGMEGMQRILANAPDLIITDIKMPGIDGLDMIQAIRSALPGSKVIVITAYAEFEYAQKAIQTGVADLIVKPIDDDQLEKSIRKAVEELSAFREKHRQIAHVEIEKEKLAGMVQDALPLIRQDFLRQLVNEDCTDSGKTRQTADSLGLHSNVYALLLIRAKKQNDSVAKVKSMAAARSLSCVELLSDEVHILLLYPFHSGSVAEPEFSGIVAKIHAALVSEPHAGEEAACSAGYSDLAQTHVVYAATVRSWREQPYRYAEAADASYSLLTRNVLKYVSEHIKEDLTLSHTAALFDISPGYLSSLIKKDTGDTFTELVSRGKIQLAKRLLLDPKCRIGEVGGMLGFKDYAYFYQVFKKYAGCSPKEYQKGAIE